MCEFAIQCMEYSFLKFNTFLTFHSLFLGYMYVCITCVLLGIDLQNTDAFLGYEDAFMLHDAKEIWNSYRYHYHHTLLPISILNIYYTYCNLA